MTTVTPTEIAGLMATFDRIGAFLDDWIEVLTDSPERSEASTGHIGIYRGETHELLGVEAPSLGVKGHVLGDGVNGVARTARGDQGARSRTQQSKPRGEHRLPFRFQFIGLHNVEEAEGADSPADQGQRPPARTAWAQGTQLSAQVRGPKAQVRRWIERITTRAQGAPGGVADPTAFDPGALSHGRSPVVVTPPRKFLHSPSHPLSHKRSSVLPASIARIPLDASINTTVHER